MCMKRTPLSRGTKTLKRSEFKQKATPKKKKVRSKLPTVKSMRNKCDKLLTPIVKAMHPNCMLQKAQLCEGMTQCAHHHILKSKSTALRYELENLIPLCNRCHMLLHSHESYYSSILVQRKGLEWFESLENKKEAIIKADVHFYIANYARLKEIHDKLI